MSKAPPEEKALPPQPAPAAKAETPIVNKGLTPFVVLNLEWPGEDGATSMESVHCLVGDSIDLKAKEGKVIVTVQVARIGSTEADLGAGGLEITAREPAKATS